jgi:hypothetical protein
MFVAWASAEGVLRRQGDALIHIEASADLRVMRLKVWPSCARVDRLLCCRLNLHVIYVVVTWDDDSVGRLLRHRAIQTRFMGAAVRRVRCDASLQKRWPKET